MSDAYLPGQLYRGADGDLLFVILGEDGTAFMTNRGTRLTLQHVAEVYAPLTLVRPVQGEAPDPAANAAQELAAAVRDALDVPVAADGAGSEDVRLASVRGAFLVGALGRLAGGDASMVSATVKAVRRADERYPVTYPTRDEQAGGEVR